MSAAEDTDRGRLNLPPTPFLNAERVRLYALAVLLAYAVVVVAFLLADLFWQHEIAPLMGNDFRVFWAASRLGLEGHGADSYDIDRLFPLQQSTAPRLVYAKPWQHWFYPPPFLLAVLPLGLIPYYASFLLFNAAGLWFYLRVLRSVIPLRAAVLVALSAPAVLFTVINGQNAFFTAGLAGLGLILLERRPSFAGILIGLLVIKPHLALLFGVALVAGKAWRAFCWSLGSGLSLLAASLLVFSPQSGVAFLEQVRIAKSFAEQGLMPLEKMPTVFAALRLLGLQVSTANWVHATVALAAAVSVGWLWRREAPPYLRNAALILGCLLVSPHLFDYDLVWLAWPIGWLAVHAFQYGWQPGERLLLILAWAGPMVGNLTARVSNIQITPLVILLLLAMLVRRERVRGRAHAHITPGPGEGNGRSQPNPARRLFSSTRLSMWSSRRRHDMPPAP